MTADKGTRSEERKLTTKSSRHSKVSGQFGEILVAYLLSKEGFEVAQVDHTGLDILAVNPKGILAFAVSPAAEMKYRALPNAHFVSWKRDEFNLDVLKR